MGMKSTEEECPGTNSYHGRMRNYEAETALCPRCGKFITIRKNGRMRSHKPVAQAVPA